MYNIALYLKDRFYFRTEKCKVSRNYRQITYEKDM